MGSQFTEVFDRSLWVLQDDEKCIKKLPLSKVFRYNKGKVSMWFNFFCDDSSQNCIFSYNLGQDPLIKVTLKGADM